MREKVLLALPLITKMEKVIIAIIILHIGLNLQMLKRVMKDGKTGRRLQAMKIG